MSFSLSVEQSINTKTGKKRLAYFLEHLIFFLSKILTNGSQLY